MSDLERRLHKMSCSMSKGGRFCDCPAQDAADLERRLHEIADDDARPRLPESEYAFSWADLLTAARIGAEVEREAIAQYIDSTREWDGGPPLAGMLVKLIRERGNP